MAETTSQAPETTEAGDNTPAAAPQASKKSTKRAAKEDPRGRLVKMHGVEMYLKG